MVFVGQQYNLSDPSNRMMWNAVWANASRNWPPTPGLQLWGVITAPFDFGAIINGTDPDLGVLTRHGYKYCLWQSGQFSALLNASVPRVDISDISPAAAASLAASSPITISFTVVKGNTWCVGGGRHGS